MYNNNKKRNKKSTSIKIENATMTATPLGNMKIENKTTELSVLPP